MYNKCDSLTSNDEITLNGLTCHKNQSTHQPVLACLINSELVSFKIKCLPTFIYRISISSTFWEGELLKNKKCCFNLL